MMKIGLYDAGFGGISILNSLRKEFPDYEYRYLADTRNFPYYLKTRQQLDELSLKNCEFLIDMGCDVVVIACNTSTVVSLAYVRQKCPHKKIIGITPPLRRAAGLTKTGHIAVLSTPKTKNSAHVKMLIDQYGSDLVIHNLSSENLSILVEAGKTTGPEITKELRKDLESVRKDNKVDVLALGCTHYPFASTAMKEVIARDIQIIDSSADTIEQIHEMAKLNEENPRKDGSVQYFTSGNPAKLNQIAKRLFDEVSFTKIPD